jgi:hypothetical protein
MIFRVEMPKAMVCPESNQAMLIDSAFEATPWDAKAITVKKEWQRALRGANGWRMW